MRDTVIVFARVPRLGTVKRRLARDIGDRAALRFHLATLTALLRDLTRRRGFQVILAQTPDRAAFRLPVPVRRIPQGRGVFGPAADGGYWVIALGPRRPADLFGKARWSTKHAMKDTLKQFRRYRVGLVRKLHDVDTKADWKCWRRQLEVSD